MYNNDVYKIQLLDSGKLKMTNADKLTMRPSNLRDHAEPVNKEEQDDNDSDHVFSDDSVESEEDVFNEPELSEEEESIEKPRKSRRNKKQTQFYKA